MKLGISYSLFDSEELLEYSIKSIRSNVDYVSVVYQTVSYHGEPCNEGLVPLLLSLKSQGIIDELVHYTPFFNDDPCCPSHNETAKRNLGLEVSRAQGCDYHMTIDADEFYLSSEFEYMKAVMEQGGFDSGACQHVQYYKDSQYVLDPCEPEYVAAIEKINPDTKYTFMLEYPLSVDPTRKCNNKNVRIFTRFEVQMHHMSFVRKDIRKKLKNHTSRRFFSDESIERIATYYENWQYPQPVMWAGEKLLTVVKMPRLFEIYPVE